MVLLFSFWGMKSMIRPSFILNVKFSTTQFGSETDYYSLDLKMPPKGHVLQPEQYLETMENLRGRDFLGSNVAHL